ncbi:MAG: phosphatase PAP2 family protein [Candidatus Vogelbacteria bacterium]|nr:phosphatase PAP2 family protein [Candidatus Vogelbacteria bacterium]
MINYFNLIDLRAEAFILSFYSNIGGKVFNLITQFGGPIFVILLFLFLVFVLWKKHRSFLKYYISFFVLNEVLVYILKIFIDRPRPIGAIKYGEVNGSMPSGHAAAAIFIYGFICYLILNSFPKMPYRKVLASFLVVFVILIGFSRLYLDVHFLSDVIIGYLVGGFSLWLLISHIKSTKND